MQFLRKKGYKIAEPGKSANQKGYAYDLTGPSLQAIERGVRDAVKAGVIILRRGSKKPILHEVANHCIHVEIEAVKLLNSDTLSIAWCSLPRLRVFHTKRNQRERFNLKLPLADQDAGIAKRTDHGLST